MQLFKLALIIAAANFFIVACAKTDLPLEASSANSNVNSAKNDSTAQTIMIDNEFADAKNTYDKKCLKCHLATGEGGKIQIDTVALNVPNFKDPRNQDDDDTDYIEKVERGASGKMPAFKGKLTDLEIKSVVGYIRREFQNK